MIVLAGIERGLTYDAIQQMTIGQVVDYVIEYNNRNSETKKERPRKATRQDIRDYFGV
jgi:hypothetical protein